MKDGTFKLRMYEKHFENGEFFNTVYGVLEVTSEPKRKWYKMLLQYITFTIYKAPWEYTVKPLENE